MKRFFFIILLLACMSCSNSGTYTFKVDRIWDQGYSAFPSIERFDGKWYVSFREGESHIFDKNGIAAGKSRVICSKDGKKWQSVALLSKEGYDFRDPKLSVTPDGRLMMIMGGSIYKNKELIARRPHVSFSSDGKNFSEPEEVTIDGVPSQGEDWIWRVTWHEGMGYAVTYGSPDNPKLVLLTTKNGVDYTTLTNLEVDGFPNETTLRFLPDGRMAALVRRDGPGQKCYWGTSPAPYNDWSFRDLKFRIGGPDMIVMDDGSIIVGGRDNACDKPSTALWKVDTEERFQEAFILPSGGDTSYPGFALVDDELWVVYYSSHELKKEDGNPRAGIYLARLPISLFE